MDSHDVSIHEHQQRITTLTYISREGGVLHTSDPIPCELLKVTAKFFQVLLSQNKILLFLFYPGTKTAAAPARSSGPSSRPPWVTDPNFADRFRPDKTSTVMTQHQQPAQPTPMQNRSSIMQAAQQAPEESGRTPLCGACNKIIR